MSKKRIMEFLCTCALIQIQQIMHICCAKHPGHFIFICPCMCHFSTSVITLYRLYTKSIVCIACLLFCYAQPLESLHFHLAAPFDQAISEPSISNTHDMHSRYGKGIMPSCCSDPVAFYNYGHFGLFINVSQIFQCKLII